HSTWTTQRGLISECSHSPNGALRNIPGSRGSLRLDVRRTDHLGPLLGFLCDQPSKVGGREREHVATHVGKPRLEPGIGKASVDLPVELVDDFDRRGLRCADAIPTARLVT